MAKLIYRPTGLWPSQAEYLNTRHARLLERAQGTGASARDARRELEAMRPTPPVPLCPVCNEPVSGHTLISSTGCVRP